MSVAAVTSPVPWRYRLIRALFAFLIRYLIRPVLTPRVPIQTQRRLIGLATRIARLPRDIRRDQVSLGGVPAERHHGAGSGTVAFLYLHGGGYCIGAARGYRSVAAWLAHYSGLDVYVPDYRLAPEHPYPAAVDDALAAYRALLDQGTGRIVVGGDSAGGGLTLALALAARDAGLPAPVAQVLFSPWVDLDPVHAASMRDPLRREPLLTVEGLRHWSATYLGDQLDAARQPKCSPLYGSFTGMPPTLIQGGSDELMLEDFLKLAERLTAAGVVNELQVGDGLWHVFQVQAGLMIESDQALQRVAAFLRKVLA